MKEKLWLVIILIVVIFAIVGSIFLSCYIFPPSEPIPEAPFTVFPQTVYTNETVTFNATMTNGTDGSAVNYLWEFGDGKTATGATVTHAYDDDGSYAVKLTVTSDDRTIGSSTAAQIVLNRPPVASFIKNFTLAKLENSFSLTLPQATTWTARLWTILGT